MSIAKDIAQALSDRAARVTIANGFLTDSGTRVFRGKRRLAPEDVPCIVIFEGDDTVQDRAGKKSVKLAQRYVMEAFVDLATDGNPNDKAHDMLRDLKVAVFTPSANGEAQLHRHVSDAKYAGRGIGTREEGENVIFARIEFDLEFREDLANP